MAYTKPTPQEMRKVSNSFGSMNAAKMIDTRARATKMVLMDYAMFLLNDEKLSSVQTKEMILPAINKAVESGLCTIKMKDTIFSFIDKKSKKPDPILKLHCAITMETLEAVGGPGNTEVSALPQEIQDAVECDGDCGNRPSIESLANDAITDCQKKLFRNLGGTLAAQVFNTLGNTLNIEYTKTR